MGHTLPDKAAQNYKILSVFFTSFS